MKPRIIKQWKKDYKKYRVVAKLAAGTQTKTLVVEVIRTDAMGEEYWGSGSLNWEFVAKGLAGIYDSKEEKLMEAF